MTAGGRVQWSTARVPHLLGGIVAGLWLMLVAGTAWAGMVGAVMASAEVPYYLDIQKGFEEELAKLGGTAEMYVLKPSARDMAWRNSVRKLVVLEAKVIVAYGGGPALAAMAEAPDLPIVYCGVFEPAAIGLTGRNVTGVEAKVPLRPLLQSLNDISHFTRLGILYSGEEADSRRQAETVAELAGGDVVKIDVKGDVESIALPEGVRALFLTCAGAIQNRKAIAGLVKRARGAKIATASVMAGSTKLGVLISMSASAEQQAQETAKMVAHLLKGGEVSTLPVVSGRKVEMSINVTEAKALGLTVPPAILDMAEVVE